MQSLWMLFAAFAFSLMGVGVKLASEIYGTGEIVFYRSLIGVIIMWTVLASSGTSVRTPHMAMHIKRSLFGVTALLLWFTSITMLPLATAMTLNYMSPVWIALILGAGAALTGTGGADRKLIGAILMSFGGVICLLQPSVGHNQLTGGLIGLISGMFTALAYVEVRQLGQLGEPEGRIVFYFSAVGMVVGLAWMLYTGPSTHTWRGAGLLLAIGILATLGPGSDVIAAVGAVLRTMELHRQDADVQAAACFALANLCRDHSLEQPAAEAAQSRCWQCHWTDEELRECTWCGRGVCWWHGEPRMPAAEGMPWRGQCCTLQDDCDAVWRAQ